jgi:large subunit ribosomal protein L1
MSGRGKRYTSARSQIDRESVYAPVEAIHMLKEFAAAKFDETVEVHFRLGLNVRHADQQLRGTLMLPNGTGKNVRVAVFAEGEKAKEAEDAGADVVGSADLAKRVTVTFDIAKAVGDAKAGKVEYRTDRGANVHVSIGKRSFAERALLENYATLVEEIMRAKPAAAKGRYIQAITLTTTMGPGIHVDPTKVRDLTEELEEEQAVSA